MEDRRNPASLQRRDHLATACTVAHQHRDVGRGQGALTTVVLCDACLGEHRLRQAHHVVRDGFVRWVLQSLRRAAAQQYPCRHGAHGETAAVAALHVHHRDGWVAQGKIAEEFLHACHDGTVGAVVHRQRQRRGGAGGVEVTHEVGTAEAVDGLFGVTDQHRGVMRPDEGVLDDAPLQRVGVLELIHEYHRETLPERVQCPVADGG